MPDSELSSHTLDLLRVCLNREMDLLNERAKMFLTFDSVLMTAFAFGRSSISLSIVIPLLGLATSLLWLYLGHRTLLMYGYFRDRVKAFEMKLPEEDRVFKEEEEFREKEHPPFLATRVSAYIGYGLPLAFMAAWFSLLILRP